MFLDCRQCAPVRTNINVSLLLSTLQSLFCSGDIFFKVTFALALTVVPGFPNRRTSQNAVKKIGLGDDVLRTHFLFYIFCQNTLEQSVDTSLDDNDLGRVILGREHYKPLYEASTTPYIFDSWSYSEMHGLLQIMIPLNM